MPQRAFAGRIELKPTQERVLAALRDEGSLQLTRSRYEEIAAVSRSQAAYDLAELVEAGILERVGGGRSTRYRLARRDHPGQRRWTNDRIRSSLKDFCAGRGTWPSASEFRAAGHSDLYVAASRYGGIGFWAAELGFPRPGRARPEAPRRSWRARLRWAAAGAGLAALLFSAAGVVLYSLQNAPSRRGAVEHRAHSSAAAKPSAPTHTGAGSRQRAVAAKPEAKAGRARDRTARGSSASRRSQTYATGYRTELAVQRMSPTTRDTVSTPREEPARQTAPSAGPAPIPAPPSAAAPAPIPPPHP